MRILIYKRTHTGDPDLRGQFGTHDCMGKVRDYNYDAVIGVGGVSAEPRSYGIDRRINWVGIGPHRASGARPRGSVVTFEHYVLLDDTGPLLEEKAPALARRLFQGGARYILRGYSDSERKEAEKIVEWSRSKKSKASDPARSPYRGSSVKCCPLKPGCLAPSA